MGARFAKWRAVIAVGDGIPSRGCIEANAQALARYAALCQEAGLVPVVEPEVLMDGGHTLERCGEVTEEVLRTVFNQLYTQRVMLEGMILKPNMVLPGLTCPPQEKVSEVGVGEQQYQVRLIDRQQEDVSEVDKAADATVKCLLKAVPAAVPGIAFLSGGQSAELASARLNAMNVRFKSRLPWALAFSFARAIQQPALEIWQGQDANVPAAQTSSVSSSQMQPGCAPWRIQCLNGKDVSMTTRTLSHNSRHGSPSKPITRKSASYIFGSSSRTILKRGERMTVAAVGIYFDYSKHRITDETLKSTFAVG